MTETTLSPEAVAVLRKARELVARPGGWVQDSLKVIRPDRNNSYCAVGALQKARLEESSSHRYMSRYMSEANWDWMSEANWRSAAFESEWALQEILKQLYPNSFHSVISFNDDSGTTQEDVVALFDKALGDYGILGEGND